MMFSRTTATKRIYRLSKKIRAIAGGTSASKTISILIYLIARCQTDKPRTLTSVISESTPHLKRGAVRDFKNIMQSQEYWSQDNWNATDMIYTFETGSQLEFFSADQSDKLRGGRRDRAFMNEANNLTLDAFDQIEVRTKEFIFLDWNPTSEFWFYTEIQGKREDVDFITLTYLDNEALSNEIVKSIESRRNRKRWFTVYGLGLLGEVEGRIYKDWKIIDDIPHEARLVRRGMDMGYSVDPSVIEDLYQYNGGYIIDERVYQKGLSNRAIAELVLAMEEPQTLIIADSAEPKSIAEISDYGVNIIGAIKGPGSVNKGIQYVQDQKISVTRSSRKTIIAYNNYMWKEDKKTGKFLQVPDDAVHEWSNPCDSIRYALGSYNVEKEDDLEDDEGYARSKHSVTHGY